MTFTNAYEEFIQYHVNRRGGAAAGRIADGLQHAEKLFLENVWWPAFHNFEYLHPEYAIRDFKDGQRYIDFAYIHPHFRLAIEIDGIGSHWRDISQEQFSDHCQRQNHLVIDGWHVLRFAYKDVHERPRLCQQTLQQWIGRVTGDESSAFASLKLIDREIVRLAMSVGQPVSVREVVRRTQLENHAVIRHLKHLVATCWLEPAGGSIRIHSYRLHPSRTHLQL